MVSLNATLILQVIQLVVLIFILNRIMFRPILKLVTERDSFLDNTKLNVRNMESEIQRLKDVFLSEETAMKEKASRQGRDMKDAAIVEMRRLIEESTESAAAIKSEAMQKAQEQFERARPLLDKEVGVLADAIVNRVIGRRIEA